TTGAGSLSLNGGVTVNAASASASIAGKLSLQAATRTFNVADGAASPDLLISAVIDSAGAGTAGIIKTGSGTLQMSAANTYGGTTIVNGGTLVIANASALGATNQGTFINSNAMLSLNGVSVGAEVLGLSKASLSANSGSNFWAGNIQLTNNCTLSVDTNSALTLPGVISGPGTLLKTGDGTLVFSGNATNSYSGGTTLNQGILLLSKTISNAVPGSLI